MDTTYAVADVIRNKIVYGTPFVSGVCKISPYDARIVYGLSNNAARWIDLASPTPEALEELAAACQPATFGRNNEDVYDETYKAGKMDVSDFVSSLDLHTYGIIDSIQRVLLKEGQSIRAEIYKLNVYDTPRGKNMIGSLVVVFPTPHQGGALVLRHSTGESTFDSGSVLQGGDSPSIAYVAFFSDVEHEVLTVTAGHRVTLTWNLFLLDNGVTMPAQSLAPLVDELTKTISLALSDPSFMPEGGTIGFGLNHQYPVNDSGLNRFKDISRSLKGSDADLHHALTQVGLFPSVMGLYMVENCGYHWKTVEDLSVLISDIPDVDGQMQTESILDQLVDGCGAEVVYNYGDNIPDGIPEENTRQVHWVVKPKATWEFSTPYIAYGNEASINYLYANLVLIADISSVGKRIKT